VKKLNKRPLYLRDILRWADQHREATGHWPTKTSGVIPQARLETWAKVDCALRTGTRGLDGGSSLARFLADHRGLRNIHDQPDLRETQILAWAAEHHDRTGHWPTKKSGKVAGTGEVWTSATEEPGKKMAKILGWLTMTGLALIVLASAARVMEVGYPLPIIVLCLGSCCFLLGGVPWAHTRGNRVLKIIFLGMVGFNGGGAAGAFLGEAVAPSGGENLGTAILAVLLGFWVSAILFGSLGVWWGIRVHRRFNVQG
jgi:hypothetical protein